MRGSNVLDAPYDAGTIADAVTRCLEDEAFRADARAAVNPYYLGGAGPKVASVLADVPLDRALLRKRMTLAGETRDGWFR